MQGSQVILSIVLLLAFSGIGALAASWYMIKRTQAFVSTAVRAEGTVVDMQSRRDTDPNGRMETFYASVVSFESRAGKHVTYTEGKWSTSKPRLARKVGVLYDPKNPEDARTHSAFALWGIPGIFGVLGLLLLSAAFAVSLSWRE